MATAPAPATPQAPSKLNTSALTPPANGGPLTAALSPSQIAPFTPGGPNLSGITEGIMGMNVEDADGIDGEGMDGRRGPGNTLTLRSLVSTKEAGVIIGRSGKNVADLRDATGCKAGVSKVVSGVNDRILTVMGGLEGVGKAYALVAQTILENPISVSPPSTPVASANNATTTIRLLISHNLMGSIIGKQGAKIKQIQDASGTRMVAGKEMLPQSTERIVEVHGTTDGIRIAVLEIGKCLLEDWERGQGTVLYHPGTVGPDGAATAYPGGVLAPSNFGGANGGRKLAGVLGNGSPTARRTTNPTSPTSTTAHSAQAVPTPSDPSLRTQNISIPADMVGCIIGKGGSKINEIRRLSGSKISIAKDAHDETMERMFTLTGTPEANEKALFLLYNQLESEKERRMQSVQEAAAAGTE